MKRIAHQGQKVLILGQSGLIASTVAEQYLKSGAEVLGVDIRPKRVGGGTFKQLDIFDLDGLEELLKEFQPQVIVNGVNLATLSSREDIEGEKKLIRFFLRLYKVLNYLPKPITYLQLGTTGSGGLGINIPFTHGDSLEDMPILKKAARAGAISSLLVLLSRSFSGQEVRIAEIKPGLAVFRATPIKEAYKDGELIALDGGESGPYTDQEFLLLTSQMRFTTAEHLAKQIIELQEGKARRLLLPFHDVTAALNTMIVTQDREDARQLKYTAREVRALVEKSDLPQVIATGSLGPPQVTRDLIFGHALMQGWQPEAHYSWDSLQAAYPAIKTTLEYLQEHSPELYRFVTERSHAGRAEILSKRKGERKATEPWQIVLPVG